MYQAKAQVSIIIWAIFVILMIALVVTGVIIGVTNFNNGKTRDNISDIKVFLKDENNVDSNYIIFSANGNKLSEGKIRGDSYTPIKIPKNENIDIYCWNEKRYTGVITKTFTEEEKRLNKTKINCKSYPIGNLEVEKVKGGLDRINNKIVLNITARNGNWNGFGMCFAWSAGIINVENKFDYTICNNGLWKNYTKYNKKTKTFNYLPEGTYKCGDELKNCKKTDANKCYVNNLGVPFEYNTKVDKCVYTGKNIKKDESYVVILDVLTLNDKNDLDYLKIIFLDSDLRYNNFEKVWKSTTENTDGDLGAKNINYEIRYGT